MRLKNIAACPALLPPRKLQSLCLSNRLRTNLALIFIKIADCSKPARLEYALKEFLGRLVRHNIHR